MERKAGFFSWLNWAYPGRNRPLPGCNRLRDSNERLRDSNQTNLHLPRLHAVKGFAGIQTHIPHRKPCFQACFFFLKRAASSTTTPSRVGMNLFQQVFFCSDMTRMEFKSLFFLDAWIFGWPQFPTWYRRRFRFSCVMLFLSKELDHVISHTPPKKKPRCHPKKGPCLKKENPLPSSTHFRGLKTVSFPLWRSGGMGG